MGQSLQIQSVGRSELCEREFYFLSLPDFSSLPDSISLPGSHLVVFVAANASDIDVSALSYFSRKLLQAGCVYFCAWGPDCGRVHDVFDENCFQIEPVIMTTWHAEDSLDEVLWFFVTNAHPDFEYGGVKSGLAISIGNSEWDEQIRRRLADIDSLKKDVLKEG
jgi:hypothetical protein